MRYPAWFPYPGSWLSAFALALLSVGIGAVMLFLVDFGSYIAARNAALDPLILWTISAVVAPIPLVAVFHHLLHRVVGKINPTLQAPEVGDVRGWFPGLLSWWEGFLSWAILWAAMLVSTAAIVMFRPVFGVSWSTLIDSNHLWAFGNSKIDTIATIAWFVTAAYLYQLQYLIEQRFLQARLKLSNGSSRQR